MTQSWEEYLVLCDSTLKIIFFNLALIKGICEKSSGLKKINWIFKNGRPDLIVIYEEMTLRF